MKKIQIFYILDAILIIFFFALALNENSTRQVGLAALESVGRFYMYGILCISALLLFALVLLLNVIMKKKSAKYK